MDSGPQGLGRPRQEPASSTAGVTRTERAPCASAAWLCCPGHLLVTLHPPGMLVLNLTLSRGFPAPSWAASCPKIARKSQRQSRLSQCPEQEGEETPHSISAPTASLPECGYPCWCPTVGGARQTACSPVPPLFRTAQPPKAWPLPEAFPVPHPDSSFLCS